MLLMSASGYMYPTACVCVDVFGHACVKIYVCMCVCTFVSIILNLCESAHRPTAETLNRSRTRRRRTQAVTIATWVKVNLIVAAVMI